MVAVARDAHLETSHANLQLQSDTVTKQDGVFTVYEGGFELSPTLPGGVHLLLGQQDLRVYVLDLMNDHAIEPRINKSTQGGITSLSFKNASNEVVRVVTDPHPGQEVDHETLRAVTERMGITYSPDAAMGKVVVQILSRLGGKRRKFKSAEYDAIVAGQGGRCVLPGAGGRARRAGVQPAE